MKTKTLKKALSLFLAVLMIALAIPFTLLTVAAEEATEIDITSFSVYGRHADEANTKLFFNPGCPDGNIKDKDITTEAQSKNGDKRPYEMCYFNADGVMTYGANPTAGGKSYYGIFIIELGGKSVVDTLSLWTPTKADGTGYLYEVGWMANDAYDIYYSVDGDSYTAVDGASYSDVVEKQSSQSPLYVAGTYNEKTGYVHEIDMKDAMAEYIAIAVSAYVPDSTNADYKEMIFYEAVVTGTVAEDPTEPPEDEPSGGEGAQSVAITKFSVYGRHADEYDTPLFFRDDCGPGRINDGNITTEAQSKNGNGRPYEMCYFNADGVMTNGANPTSGGKSYYGIFVIELKGKSVVDTLSLWTPTKANGTGYLYEVGCMANDAYDIYYSADGETYAAVENASYSDVCAKQSTDDAYYIKDSYNGQTGYVHAIDMGGVTAECIAIAVSGYMPDSGNADYKEMIFYEAVVTGTAPKLMLETGASIRIDEPTGIRFTGLVSKSYVEKLESEGKTVTMGMLITPTNYLEGIEFTKAALDGKTFDTPAYLEIDAAEETVKEDGDYYVIKCVIAKIKEANYDREFSAILYVKVDGEIVAYSDYNEVFNSRSVAEVAEAAYCDLKDAKDDTYKYEVKAFEGEAEVTKYSRYDTTQRETLYGFFGQREQ